MEPGKAVLKGRVLALNLGGESHSFFQPADTKYLPVLRKAFRPA